MSSLQNYIPDEIRKLLKSESQQERAQLAKDEVQERVKTGYKKGSLERNMGLAVLHSYKEAQAKKSVPQRDQTNQEFIQKLLNKFSTSQNAIRRAESFQLDRLKPRSREIPMSSTFRNFTNLFVEAESNQQSQKDPPVAYSPPRLLKGEKEVIRALHIGLLVSSDEKRFSSIRSIIMEHEEIMKSHRMHGHSEKELLS